MRIIDLSYPITVTMPVYPGSRPPELHTAATFKEDGYRVKNMVLNSHLGTHLEAPVHMVDGGKTLDRLPVDSFVGRATLLDLSSLQKRGIEKNDLLPFRKELTRCEFAVLATGWSRYWGAERYFQGYPALTADALLWLTGFNLKGIGLDTVSIDTDDAEEYVNHKSALQKNILIIENLTNLQSVPVNEFIFSCLPLNIENGDGSPVRAVAMIE
jgi:kynurenine formamidase